jgi:hypothetical protein
LHERIKEPSNNANKSEYTNATNRQAAKGTWQPRRLLYTRTRSGQQLKKQKVLLQVLLQILQQLLPACAQPLLWSSAQAWQGCRLARNHCCGRQLKPGEGDENEDVVLFMANASPVPFDVVTLYESCGISTKHLAGWSTIM